MSNKFNYCPDCGSTNIITAPDARKWNCKDCGYELFNNVAAAVGVVILNSKGQCLFEKRAKEPKKGMYALPGGFCEPGEPAETSLVRECMEEIGWEVKDFKFICTQPNTYLYKNILYKTCDIFFETQIDEDAVFTPQESEVTELFWLDISTKEALDKIPIAFDSTRKTLEYRLKLKSGENK